MNGVPSPSGRRFTAASSPKVYGLLFVAAIGVKSELGNTTRSAPAGRSAGLASMMTRGRTEGLVVVGAATGNALAVSARDRDVVATTTAQTPAIAKIAA